jgi:peptidoglycan/LPS O-acetylase OafA/YrhL
MPFIAFTAGLWPMRNFLSAKFWMPYSRLTYGAFLCAPMLMIFREYNSSVGTFVSKSETVLLFFAYMFLSFGISLYLTVVVERPIHRIYKTFCRKKTVLKQSKGTGDDIVGAVKEEPKEF